MFRLLPLMKTTLHGSQNVCRCMLMYMCTSKEVYSIGLTTTCSMFLHVCRLFTVFRSLAGGSEDRPTVSVQSSYITKVCKWLTVHVSVTAYNLTGMRFTSLLFHLLQRPLLRFWVLPVVLCGLVVFLCGKVVQTLIVFLVSYKYMGCLFYRIAGNFRVSGKFPISRRKRSRMGRGLHVVTWNHLILLRIAKIAESYSIHTSVRGYHVYKDVWEAALGQLLPCQRKPGTCNIHDPYAVAVVETGVATRIVGHVRHAISSVCHLLSDL